VGTGCYSNGSPTVHLTEPGAALQ